MHELMQSINLSDAALLILRLNLCPYNQPVAKDAHNLKGLAIGLTGTGGGADNTGYSYATCTSVFADKGLRQIASYYD
jgi:hypothetical protein